MNKRFSVTFKILELLGTGFHLRYARSKKSRRLLYEQAGIAWHSIDRKQLYRTLHRLRLQGLVEVNREANKMDCIQLTQKGRAFTLRKHFNTLTLKKPRQWDKKWRMVLYDIPEGKKAKRDALRKKLKELGFLEFQKSTFVYPHSCEDEINFIINFFDIEDDVYCITASIHPDDKLRAHFKLR